MVYLPMGYLWGSRWVYADAEVDEAVLSLRRELYPDPYADIDWRATRSLVAPIDDYSPVGVPMKLAQLPQGCWSSFVLEPVPVLCETKGPGLLRGLLQGGGPPDEFRGHRPGRLGL